MVKAKETKIEIIQNGDPVLRSISEVISTTKIKTPEIKKIIKDMREAIKAQPDAAAISAVQIDKPVRLFIISKHVFNMNPLEENPIKLIEKKVRVKDDMVFINPKIIKSSKTKQILEEGCLSVRYMYGKVSRSEKTIVEAYDENGKKFVRGFSGLLSQIVQHETDHLNGILFIDKATDLAEISHEEYEKMLKELK